MHPQGQNRGQITGIKGRLVLCGCGILIALVGVGRLRLGEFVVRHWTGQPFYSAGLVAVGVFVIVMAFVPLSWIGRLAQTQTSPGARPGNKAHRLH